MRSQVELFRACGISHKAFFGCIGPSNDAAQIRPRNCGKRHLRATIWLEQDGAVLTLTASGDALDFRGSSAEDGRTGFSDDRAIRRRYAIDSRTAAETGGRHG